MKKLIRVLVLGTSMTCALAFGGVNAAQAQKWPILPQEFFSGLTTPGPDQHNECSSKSSLGVPGETGTGGGSSGAAQPGPPGGFGSDCRNTRG